MDSGRFFVVRGALDPRTFGNLASSSEGAIVTFFGIVRSRSEDGRAVVGLSYEAYEPMACDEFKRVSEEARERFGDVRLWIAHATGDLGVGEVAVAVVAAAQHRAAAFDACRYAIDQVKARAPIWKKERYADGAPQWRANETDE